MKISRIIVRSFKGVDAEIQPAALNWLVGPNGTGKSARVAAIRFGLTGTVSVGGTADAIGKFSGPHGCSVRVTLDDGFEFTRIVDRTPGGSIKRTVTLDGLPAMSLVASCRIISDRVGGFVGHFDVGHFLRLSTDARSSYLLTLASSAGVADCGPKLIDAINSKQQAIAHKSPITPLAVQAVLGVVLSGVEVTADPLYRLLAISLEAKRMRNADTKAIKAKEAALGEITISDDAAVHLGLVEDTDRELLVTADDRDDCERKRATLIGLHDARTAAEKRVKTLSAEVDALTERREGHDAQLSADAVRSEIDRQAIALEELRDMNELALTAAHDTGEERDRVTTELRKHRQKLEEIERQLGDPLVECREIVALLLAAQSIKADSFVLKTVKDLEGLLYSLAPSDRDTLEASRDRLADNVETLDGQHDRAITAAAEAITEGRAALVRVRKAELDAVKAKESADATLDVIQKHEDVTHRLSGKTFDLVEAKRIVDQLAPPVALGPSELKEESRRLTGRLKELRETKAAIEKNQADRNARATLAADAAELQTSVDVLDLIREAANGVRDQLLTELVEPMLADIDRVLQAGFDNRLRAFFHPETGDLGFIDEARGRLVPVECASGGEAAVFCAGVAFAFVKLADCNVRVLAIEAAEIDADHVIALAKGLEAIVDDVDHIFVATHAGRPTGVEWAITDTGKPACTCGPSGAVIVGCPVHDPSEIGRRAMAASGSDGAVASVESAGVGCTCASSGRAGPSTDCPVHGAIAAAMEADRSDGGA